MSLSLLRGSIRACFALLIAQLNSEASLVFYSSGIYYWNGHIGVYLHTRLFSTWMLHLLYDYVRPHIFCEGNRFVSGQIRVGLRTRACSNKAFLLISRTVFLVDGLLRLWVCDLALSSQIGELSLQVHVFRREVVVRAALCNCRALVN